MKFSIKDYLKRKWKNILCMLVAVFFMGVGIAVINLTGLGPDPCSALHYAMSEVTGLSFGKPDERGWRTGRAVATVPEHVDTLVFVFNVNQEANEKCWVDDAEIVRVK